VVTLDCVTETMKCDYLGLCKRQWNVVTLDCVTETMECDYLGLCKRDNITCHRREEVSWKESKRYAHNSRNFLSVSKTFQHKICFERSLKLPVRSKLGSTATTLDRVEVCPQFGNSANN